MKYFLVAGERSGDLHGSNLIHAIRTHDPQAQVQGWGGDQMEKEGMDVLVSIKSLAFMGFWEVVKNLPTIYRLTTTCKSQINAFQPDALILIDYSGFNLRIAAWAKKQGYRVFYYIAPKVWAWNTGRVKSFPQKIDHLFCIFPFEVEFFKKHHFHSVEYVGNPLVDAMSQFVPKNSSPYSGKPIIALLPGSRYQEVISSLPRMLEAVAQFPMYQPVVAGVSNLPETLYNTLLQKYPQVQIWMDTSYDVLSVAQAAIVTSGTATLETAWFQVPQVVVYRTSTLSYQIAKWLIKVPYISLVNLVMGRGIVTELIQTDLTTQRLVDELSLILPGGQNREKQLADLRVLRDLIGQPGASYRTGERIVHIVNNVNTPI